ncbi:MAG: lyase family protein, partial [Dehalococcoidia bacterium]
MTPKTRLESDLLGDIAVPVEVLYGAQTQRALQNFPLRGERTIGSYPRLVEGLLLVKQAAATANLRAGLLEARQARAIIDAARRLLEQPRADQFPVHRLHGGGGTSAHMNVNEVLANLAEELLGGARGQYRLIHPNDHVNLHQSTNDVYPTAGHIAILRQWPHLEQSLDGLIGALLAKANEWSQQPRIARTCLQDGV